MTQSIDTDRAEFEAVASDYGECPKAIERDAKGNYLLMHTATGWMWWQSARRAPAAPVPQGWKLVPSESTEEMARAFRADDAPHYFVMTTMRCNDFAERYRAAISAAPQPPEATVKDSLTVEAAPVQMPESRIFWIEATTQFCIKRGGEVPFASAWEPLYTEQQVRQLLSNHGIKANK